ncbi:hypothetical protein SAMN04489761_1212 [Tenacibaculum sp. MAR_2009_124]|uniref:hypothetical protein n=1 Tax=Tenacibaculum sp. MAR_2009_124 TaxID=1250059 RepID=UPI00089485C7|nr:hypothetical protein [Tenacibaculum sp. MAR_2009_124]SEB52485.1 hypothetical protein SAMN04489761_1212 [Tenacibaculum sp. MAR_2009_124]
MQKLFTLLLALSYSFVFANNLSEINTGNESQVLRYHNLLGHDNFDENFLIENYTQNPKVDTLIAKASAIFDKLEEKGNYVDVLGSDDMVSLPIGVKKKIGGLTTVLGISKARFYPNYTEVTAFIKLVLPQSRKDGSQIVLFFGADNLKISHKGGIVGDTNISLLGNIPIPINGNKALLELKGGFNMKTGTIDNKTYVTIDCSGIKEIGVAADVLFSRDLVEPVDANFKRIEDVETRVKGSFQTVVSDWNDIIAEVSLSPFQLTNKRRTDGKGKAGLIFEVNTAVFDFSDLRNSERVEFTDSYRSKYLVAGNEELWRGVFIKSLKIALPKEFKENGSDERITFTAANLLLDNEGISGKFSAKNVLALDKGNASGWQFSVHDLHANLEANKITGAGFGGNIVLPVSKKLSKDEVANLSKDDLEKRTVKYEAIIDVAKDEYSLSLSPLKKLEFDVFKAKAELLENSKIELKVSEGKFRPKAVLHGSLNINASNAKLENGKKGIVDFKGVKFQKLQLQTESPYFSVDYMGYEGDVKFAKFPVTISEIGVTANDQKTSLSFAIDVNLMGKGFAGGTKLDIVGKFHEENELHRWKFDRVDIQRIKVEADLGKVKFKGFVDIKDNDPVYGNGFYGELEADFNNINIKATAWFGKTDVRYWYVDAYADLSSMPTKPTIGPLSINGFGGGAYYHMTKKSKPPLQLYDGEPVTTPPPPSGMDYVPNKDTGLGFRAMIGFETANKSAFNGKIGFEMEFNKRGGLNRIFFFGEAHIMKSFDIGLGDKLKEKLGKIEDKINDLAESDLVQKLKETNLVEYSKVTFPQDGLTFDAGIDAHFSMEMDFQNSSFHAEMEVYVNTPGNFFSGVGPKGRAGWAVFHSSSEGWYLHMGTPKDRIGLRVGIGGFSVQATTYLMIGDKIPGSPPPPQAVADILGVNLSNLDYMRDLNALGDGRGFAIGMDLSIDTGDMNFLIFYARFRAGLGFDIMIKDYGETACKGSGQIGVDGWYANGQAYAYLEGELGINIRLWFIKKKIPIIKAGAAVLLQAKLPNPSWFRGYVGGHFNILGGLISGKFRFKIELGDECEVVGGAPLGGLKIISGVTPEDQASEIDVFTAPQAAFNMKINEAFELEDDQGVKTYRILLDEFVVTKEGVPIEGELEWSESKDVANFISFDVLPPKSTLTAKVIVSFQELKGGSWITILTNGKKAQEIEERTFTTGEAPDYIPVKNIVYSYPVIDQKYFYQDETNNGYVKLKRGQPYLFKPETNWTQNVRYTNVDGHSTTNSVSYNKADRMVNFTLSKLQKSKEYTVQLISIPEGKEQEENSTSYTEKETGQEGNSVKVRNKNVQNVVNSDVETELLKYNFSTSKYKTFEKKIRAKNIVKHYLEPIYSDVHAIQTDMEESERFDVVELEGSEYSGYKALITVEAVLDDSYYEDRIYDLIYKGYPLEPDFTFNRSVNELGLPPKKGVDILTWYVPYLKQNPNFSLLDKRMPFRYNLPYHYKMDFIDLQYKVVNKYLNFPDQYASQIQQYNYIINGIFPAISSGKYKVKMQYVLPGNKLGSKAIFKYKNPF